MLYWNQDPKMRRNGLQVNYCRHQTLFGSFISSSITNGCFHVYDSILFPSSCVLCCVHRFNLCTFLWCPPAHGNMVGGGSTIAGRAATVSAVQLSSIIGSNRSQSQFLPPLLCRVFSTCRFCRTPIQSNPIYMNTDGSTAIFKTFTTYYTPNEFVTLGPVGYISNFNFPHGVYCLL